MNKNRVNVKLKAIKDKDTAEILKKHTWLPNIGYPKTEQEITEQNIDAFLSMAKSENPQIAVKGLLFLKWISEAENAKGLTEGQKRGLRKINSLTKKDIQCLRCVK